MHVAPGPAGPKVAAWREESGWERKEWVGEYCSVSGDEESWFLPWGASEVSPGASLGWVAEGGAGGRLGSSRGNWGPSIVSLPVHSFFHSFIQHYLIPALCQVL